MDKNFLPELEALLTELRDYFEQRADADMQGDPPRFVPNVEMQFQVAIETMLDNIDGAIYFQVGTN